MFHSILDLLKDYFFYINILHVIIIPSLYFSRVPRPVNELIKRRQSRDPSTLFPAAFNEINRVKRRENRESESSEHNTTQKKTAADNRRATRVLAETGHQ